MKDNSKEHGYQDLLKLIDKGNEKAFVKLYDLFWPELLKHILAKVDDVQVAEDIIHDLFISLWNKREEIMTIESIPAYLYSSCRYLIFRHYRKNMLVDYSNEQHDIMDSDPSLEDRLYYRYLLDIVEKEIEDLPAKCREVFKLSRFEYLSNKEIAEKLAISESTVENHINKAIKKLKSSSDRYLIFFTFFL